MKPFTIIICISFLSSCISSRSYQKSNAGYDAAIADSMLAHALDHEAIYTLLDTLKPMSSVKFLQYKIVSDSSTPAGAERIVSNDSLLKDIKTYQRICNTLSNGDWQFIVVPFAMTYNGNRNIEIYVVRKSRFKSLLHQKQLFFGQWGFTADADPATVLPIVEYEKKYNRFRAYGYLFGYPDYAVDFFVNAAITSDTDTSIHLVPRDFFAIPVYASEKGYFTYAMPKNHQPTSVDSSTYYKAMRTLETYKAKRQQYINKNGGLNATALWRDWNKELFRQQNRIKE